MLEVEEGQCEFRGEMRYNEVRSPSIPFGFEWTAYIFAFMHTGRGPPIVQIWEGIRYYSSFFFMREISGEIDERERSEFLLNRFRDEDGFFESLSTVIGLDLDFDFLIKNSIFLRMVQGQERLDEYIVIERIQFGY